MTGRQAVARIAYAPTSYGVRLRGDALQDMYVAILSAHRTFDGVEDAVKYGLASVRHAHARQAHRRVLLERGLRLLAPLMEHDHTETDCVDIALSVEQMPTRERQVIRAIAWDGATVRECAQWMGLSPSSVQMAVQSARAMLR